MPIPDFQTLRLPLLEALSGGQERLMRDVTASLADRFELSDEQLESLVNDLSAFAAWLDCRRACPDDAPFFAYANAVIVAGDFREDAVNFLSVAQAVREASRKPRLFWPDEE